MKTTNKRYDISVQKPIDIEIFEANKINQSTDDVFPTQPIEEQDEDLYDYRCVSYFLMESAKDLDRYDKMGETPDNFYEKLDSHDENFKG